MSGILYRRAARIVPEPSRTQLLVVARRTAHTGMGYYQAIRRLNQRQVLSKPVLVKIKAADHQCLLAVIPQELLASNVCTGFENILGGSVLDQKVCITVLNQSI